MSEITGVFNILATPFDAQQQVDYDSLRRLVEFQLDKGAFGLTILGVLGEAAKLTVDERYSVMKTVIDTVRGRVPIIVGTSHNDRATCIALSRAAIAAGATGVMVAPPPMDKPTDDDVIALYDQIASAIVQPIVVQDYPVVNNINMTPDMLAALAERVPVRTLPEIGRPAAYAENQRDPRPYRPAGDFRRVGRHVFSGGTEARCQWNHDRLRVH